MREEDVRPMWYRIISFGFSLIGVSTLFFLVGLVIMFLMWVSSLSVFVPWIWVTVCVLTMLDTERIRIRDMVVVSDRISITDASKAMNESVIVNNTHCYSSSSKSYNINSNNTISNKETGNRVVSGRRELDSSFDKHSFEELGDLQFEQINPIVNCKTNL
jgi:hypothetical protein